jgi:hypothetical protein
MAREIYGPEYDPSTHDLDGEIVMRVGEGKKHGRYWIGDSFIDSASTCTLAEIRARSTSESPAIRPRPSVAQGRVDVLEVVSILFVVHSSIHTVNYLDCSIEEASGGDGGEDDGATTGDGGEDDGAVAAYVPVYASVSPRQLYGSANASAASDAIHSVSSSSYYNSNKFAFSTTTF